VHISVTSVSVSANTENILKSISALFWRRKPKIYFLGVVCSVHPARKLNHTGWDGRNVQHPWTEINLCIELEYFGVVGKIILKRNFRYMFCQKLNWIELVHIRLQWELSVGDALDG